MRNFGLQPAVPSLKPEQLHCLQIICEWQDAYGSTPKWREIAAEMELDSAFDAYWTVCEIAQRRWVRIARVWPPAILVLRRPPMPDFEEIERATALEVVGRIEGESNA